MSIAHPELFYWLASARLNSDKFRHWLTLFPDIKSLFFANEKELKHIGLTTKEIAIIKKPDWHSIEKDFQWCEKSQCKIFTIQDEQYPSLLREISAAPLILFVRGNHTLLVRPQIAIVGTRHPTPQGVETAKKICGVFSKIWICND